VTPAARTTTGFAVLQVPYAAVRKHVALDEPPPPLVDELITTAYAAVIARRRDAGTPAAATSARH
jgi:hypothetical protein